DAMIRRRLESDVVLVRQIAEYIIAGGGKRLRPALVFLAAGATGYRGEHHVELAAVVEFIHTATLLHDDVVDESELRRGRKTANAEFGNAASVLVGDFLYSRAFQIMVAVRSNAHRKEPGRRPEGGQTDAATDPRDAARIASTGVARALGDRARRPGRIQGSLGCDSPDRCARLREKQGQGRSACGERSHRGSAEFKLP